MIECVHARPNSRWANVFTKLIKTPVTGMTKNVLLSEFWWLKYDDWLNCLIGLNCLNNTKGDSWYASLLNKILQYGLFLQVINPGASSFRRETCADREYAWFHFHTPVVYFNALFRSCKQVYCSWWNHSARTDLTISQSAHRECKKGLSSFVQVFRRSFGFEIRTPPEIFEIGFHYFKRGIPNTCYEVFLDRIHDW